MATYHVCELSHKVLRAMSNSQRASRCGFDVKFTSGDNPVRSFDVRAVFILKLDSRKVNRVPQKSDSNTCRADRFAVAKSLPNVLNSSSIFGQLADMVARRDIQSIKKR